MRAKQSLIAWPRPCCQPMALLFTARLDMSAQLQSTLATDYDGSLTTAAIQAGSTRTLTVRNPWPGQQAEVVNGSTGAVVVSPSSAATLTVAVTAGQSYLVEQLQRRDQPAVAYALSFGSPALYANDEGDGELKIRLR